MDELLPTRQASINLERTAVDCEHFTLRIQRTNCSPGVMNNECTLSGDTPPVFLMNATLQMSFLVGAATDSALG
jgi:hypothetical protein